MKTKESWIDDTMNSLEGIRRATSDPGLFIKVITRTIHPIGKKRAFKRSYYWSVAAGIALLIALNILGVVYYHQRVSPATRGPEAVATDYLSYLGPVKL